MCNVCIISAQGTAKLQITAIKLGMYDTPNQHQLALDFYLPSCASFEDLGCRV